jgi:adenylosuccinate synthase
VDVEATLALLERLAPRLLPLADDVGLHVHRAIRGGAAVLLEGRRARCSTSTTGRTRT